MGQLWMNSYVAELSKFSIYFTGPQALIWQWQVEAFVKTALFSTNYLNCLLMGICMLPLSNCVLLLCVWKPASLISSHIPYSGKVWRGECLVNLFFSSVWQKKIWWMNRSAKGLLIINTTLDGFSLANCRRFAEFAKLSRYTVYCTYYVITLIDTQVYSSTSQRHMQDKVWLH